MLTGPWGSTYAWTSYNMLDSASANGNSSQLYYNGNHQRYKQVATGYPDSLETTYYIGGLMEKMATPTGTAYRHFIPAGNNTVLYVRWTTGSNPTYYITKDHLGSSSTITDSSGNLVVAEGFTEWGWRTDNWAELQPTAAEYTDFQNTTRRGFTGHEMLDNVWLVNMNGRMMASANDIPRMLSADPYTSDPTNTQSYNRYSYVNNNPLTLIDPTGFAGCDNYSEGVDQDCSDSGGGLGLPPPWVEPPPSPCAGDSDCSLPNNNVTCTVDGHCTQYTVLGSNGNTQQSGSNVGVGAYPSGQLTSGGGGRPQRQTNQPKTPCPRGTANPSAPPVVVTAQQGTFAKLGGDFFGLSADVSLDGSSYPNL